MISATIKIEGIEKTLRAFDKFGAIGDKEVNKAVEGSLRDVERLAKKKIQRDPKSGRVYSHVFFTQGGKVIPYDLRSGGKGNYNLSPTHRASAPGEPPASDTGTLASSIKVVMESQLSGWVGTDLQYGFWLEYGTTKIKPRPWLKPSLDESLPSIKARFERSMERAVKAFYGS